VRAIPFTWPPLVVTTSGSSWALDLGNCAVIAARNTMAAIFASFSIRFMVHSPANTKPRQF
jgi:hypothetical protein